MADPKQRRSRVRRDTASESRLIGTWRIYECDLWDADHLDLVDPAVMVIPTDGLGTFSFGVVTCGTDIGFAGPDDIAFTFQGSNEGDEVSGSGFAELGEDGVLEIDLSFHLGATRCRRRGGSDVPIRSPAALMTPGRWSGRSPPR